MRYAIFQRLTTKPYGDINTLNIQEDLEMKKVSRKKLKEPDEFISVTQKIFLFISHHSRKVAASGLIVFVVLLSIFLYQKWEKSKNQEAYRRFSLALGAYRNEGQPSEYKNVLEKFESEAKIVENNIFFDFRFDYLIEDNWEARCLLHL